MENGNQIPAGDPPKTPPPSRVSRVLRYLPIRQIRKLIVLVVGGTVLLIGVLMIVGPGPATLVIPAGLAILAVEFAWARRLLQRAMEVAQNQKKKLGLGAAKPPGEKNEKPK